MLSGKDLLGQFKAAAWNGPEEVEAFLTHAELVPLLMMHVNQSPEPPRKKNPAVSEAASPAAPLWQTS